MLVRIIKNWDHPDLLRQTPRNSGFWKEVEFTTKSIEECDLAIILNFLDRDIALHCDERSVWNIIQEPYLPGIFPWEVDAPKAFSRIYAPFGSLYGGRYISSYPMLPWHIDRTFDELQEMAIPEKKKGLSMVASGKELLPGHRLRNEFMRFLAETDIEIDIFGKEVRYLSDKMDGLLDYKYSVAVENSSSVNYWTEKIADCFLSYTIPFYWGCRNIGSYFPEGSFILLDINDKEGSLRKIREAIADQWWEKNLGPLTEARELVLQKYNFFSAIYDKIKELPFEPRKSLVELKKYSPSWSYRIKRRMGFFG